MNSSCSKLTSRSTLQRLAPYVRLLLSSQSLGILRRYYRGAATCVLYHRIVGTNDIGSLSGISVHRDALEEQLTYFINNFHCISIEQLAESILTSKKLPKDTLLITFDDGYRDNLIYALPLLEKYQVPATIFITSKFASHLLVPWWIELDSIFHSTSEGQLIYEGESYLVYDKVGKRNYQTLFNLAAKLKLLHPIKCASAISLIAEQCNVRLPVSSESPMLSWEELRLLDSHPLITLGCHTVSHPSLSSLSIQDAREEIQKNKIQMEAELGREVTTFAYPYGDCAHVGEREHALTDEAGFSLAFSTNYGHILPDFLHPASTKRFYLPRVSISFYDSITQVISKVSGVEAILRNNFLRSPRGGGGVITSTPRQSKELSV